MDKIHESSVNEITRELTRERKHKKKRKKKIVRFAIHAVSIDDEEIDELVDVDVKYTGKIGVRQLIYEAASIIQRKAHDAILGKVINVEIYT